MKHSEESYLSDYAMVPNGPTSELTGVQRTKLPSARISSYAVQMCWNRPYLWDDDSMPVPMIRPPAETCVSAW